MYWEYSLRQSFNLKFELVEVLVGLESLVVYYYNVTRGNKAAKVFVLGLDGYLRLIPRSGGGTARI